MSAKERIVDYLTLMRIQTAAATAMIPIIGVLVAVGFSEGRASVVDILVVFVIGVLMHTYGFTMNELLDRKVDSKCGHLNHKPLVNGRASKEIATLIVVTSALMMFSITLIHYENYLAAEILLLSMVLGLAYNCTSKFIPFSDVFIASWAMSLMIYGFVLVGGSFNEPAEILAISYMAFLQILFNNMILGGLKDRESDAKAGVRNFATTFKNGTFSMVAWGTKILFVAASMAALVVVGLGVAVPLMFVVAVIQLLLALEIITCESRGGSRERMLKLMGMHEIATFSSFAIVMLAVSATAPILMMLIPTVWLIAMNRVLYKTTINPKV